MPSMFMGKTDENERFLKARCAVYLSRLLGGWVAMDSEFVEFLFWVLDEDSDEAVRLICDTGNPRVRRYIREKLDEDDIDDLDDCVNVVLKIFKYYTKNDTKRFASNCTALLKNKAKLPDKVGSEILGKIQTIRNMFSLSDIETELCLFMFIVSVYEPAEDYFDRHLECLQYRGRKYLLRLLDIKSHELGDALSGTLQRIGLLETSHNSISLDDEFIRFFHNNSLDYITGKFYTRVTEKAIPLEYHMLDQNCIDHVMNLLQTDTSKSTHIALYGPGGAGKTSFSHGLAQAMGYEAYEIARPDEENDISRRRAALVACLNMTARSEKKSIIIVDEADRLLNTECGGGFFFFGFSSDDNKDKAWLNYFMDQPGARVIWIVNDISGIDESVMRRFSYSIKFSHFNKRQRINLWNSIASVHGCDDLLSSENVQALAHKQNASAGAIDLAVAKAKDISAGDPRRFYQAICYSLDAHRKLINGGISSMEKEVVEKNYSLEGLNIRGDLQALITQLKKFDRYLLENRSDVRATMNVLFHGDPGTGKSELGRHLAELLGRELMVKRASDFLSCWVGETEKIIARTFAEAEETGSLLLIDEADSLIFTRGIAVRSWETTQVNEFLTRMERFRGILICTTNRLTSLDEASVRRFTQKLEFRFLTVQGAEIFYNRFLAPLAGSQLDDSNRLRLHNIRDLAPGDFRVVRDRYCFYPAGELTHDMFIKALEGESRVKCMQRGGKTMGFTQ